MAVVQTHLTDTTYSTCPPGNQDWELRTGKLALDKQEGTGTARDVSLRFKGVPFLYTPYLSFPIDDRRKSGFLMPSYGEGQTLDWETNGAPFVRDEYFRLAFTQPF